ncbi:MAG: hypothetical protein IOC64_08075 [Methylobacterium sp.]|jgi:hypothetical protein|nr:hypothetical protein [Methylobacterium sp.]MCA3601240.1 hypothetical protein [Methylobacterium sp.]MCA3606434.1 hypothetical protein [Methylobacterium sp.]MCA3610401.1 hypothetical protein [Methylobacterium sp.]MCA3611961.1 hypothetical protein [Methylobacterium sp.]
MLWIGLAAMALIAALAPVSQGVEPTPSGAKVRILSVDGAMLVVEAA